MEILREIFQRKPCPWRRERVEEGKLPLGEMGRKILRINEKDKVSLRKVETGREEKVL